MFERVRSGVVACVAASLMSGAFAPSRLGAQNITPSGPPTAMFTAVGPGWYSDVGQAFIAGGSYMNSFSLWLGTSLNKNYVSGDPTSGAELTPFVAAWDGSEIVGNTLFQGSQVLVSGLSGYQELDFSTGGLALTPGTMYIAFIAAANDGVHVGNIRVGTSLDGGGAAATNLQGNAVNPLTGTWDVNTPNLGLTFAATFSDTPVTAPEPGTLVLLVTGVAGIFGTDRLRRKGRSAARPSSRVAE
jgi:hypothetical protein